MKFSKQFWAGLVAGLGVGLMTGAALVELDLLALGHKAWASLLGAILFGTGLIMARNAAPGPAESRGVVPGGPGDVGIRP